MMLRQAQHTKQGDTLSQPKGDATSLPRGWEIKKLGDVISDIKDGGTPSRTRDEFFGGDVNWCVVKDIKPEIYETKETLTDLGLKNCSAKVWEINSVIISLGATIGQIGIAKIPVATKQGIAGIVVKKETLLPKFLFYYLNLKKEFIQSIASGTTIKEVRPSKLKEVLEIPVPPLPEQQQIVSILDEAFAAIEQAKENVQRNLQNAKDLFQSELNNIFTSKGEGWVEKSLGEIAAFRNGMNFTKQSKGESIKIVGVKDFQKYFWIDLENLESVIIDGKLSDIDLLKENDILTVRSNGNPALIGRCILAGTVTEKTSHSGFTIRIRLNSNEYFSKYLCHYLKSEKAKTQLIESGTGISIKSLNQVTLSSLVIPFPSLKEQKKIVNQLDTLSTETKNLENIYQQKLDALEELKKSILQKAFSGELTENKIAV